MQLHDFDTYTGKYKHYVVFHRGKTTTVINIRKLTMINMIQVFPKR